MSWCDGCGQAIGEGYREGINFRFTGSKRSPSEVRWRAWQIRPPRRHISPGGTAMGNRAEVPQTGAKSRAASEPVQVKGADELEKERLALERDRLRLERQKTAIDARLQRRELSARREKG